MAGGEKQSRKQDLAIAALLTEADILTAAAKVGVTERTLRNWLAQPAFAAEFQGRARLALNMATALVSGSAESAVATLRRNLTCGKPAAENRAAIGILDHGCKLTEMMDLDGRIAAIEERIAELAAARSQPDARETTNGFSHRGAPCEN